MGIWESKKSGVKCFCLCVFSLSLQVNHEVKSAAKCISAAACWVEASGRRSGGVVTISAAGSSIRQPDCQTEAKKNAQDRQSTEEKTAKTVQTTENRQEKCHVNYCISLFSAWHRIYTVSVKKPRPQYTHTRLTALFQDYLGELIPERFKKLCYRRRTVRHDVSVEFLPTAA